MSSPLAEALMVIGDLTMQNLRKEAEISRLRGELENEKTKSLGLELTLEKTTYENRDLEEELEGYTHPMDPEEDPEA